MERRKYKRFQTYDKQVDLTFNEKNIQCNIIDVSLGGLSFYYTEPIPVGERMTIMHSNIPIGIDGYIVGTHMVLTDENFLEYKYKVCMEFSDELNLNIRKRITIELSGIKENEDFYNR